MLRGMGYVINSTVERSFVYFRRLCKTAQFADELQRRRANLIRRRRWTEVMKRFDGSAHDGNISTARLMINYSAFVLCDQVVGASRDGD